MEIAIHAMEAAALSKLTPIPAPATSIEVQGLSGATSAAALGAARSATAKVRCNLNLPGHASDRRPGPQRTAPSPESAESDAVTAQRPHLG